VSRKGSPVRSRPKGEQRAKGTKGRGRRAEGREVGLERGQRDKERGREKEDSARFVGVVALVCALWEMVAQ